VSGPTTTIAIADDHAIFRDGLRRLLDAEPGFRVVAEASDGARIVAAVQEAQPDVLLLDLVMPGVGGLEALQVLAAAKSSVRTIVLTARFDSESLLTAFELGARGVLLKEASTALLFKSIRSVMAGCYWLGHGHVASADEAVARQRAQLEARLRKERFSLTRRELEIVAAVAAGESNKEIAERLAISKDTIKHHLSNVFDKTGVFSRVELAAFAMNHGLLPNDRPGA
jgi:two-component system, NarL family, nitrate/nitrite response regulator NarL